MPAAPRRPGLARRRFAGALLAAVAAGAAVSPGGGAGATPERSGAAAALPAPAPRADDASVLVRFAPGPAPDAAARGLGIAAIRGAAPVPGTRWSEVETIPGRAGEVLAALRGAPGVLDAAPNYIRRISLVPDDSFWGLQVQYLGGLRIERAWDAAPNLGGGVTVAVLDTGVDLEHPDLAGQLVAGCDAVAGGCDPTDPPDPSAADDQQGHGTFVAGIVAAATDNGSGVAGVAPDADIMPVRVLASDGTGNDADIATGIAWAADHGADIVNLSLGGPGVSPVLADAVAYANSLDVLVVAAAGNSGDDTPQYPAAIPAVVAVGATGDGGVGAAFFSSRGPWVDLAAPGVAIVSTALSMTPSACVHSTDPCIGEATGTSFAAPIVAGVAALVRGEEPGLSQQQVASRLRTTARDRGPHGIDDFYGRGALDALAAVGGPLNAPAPSFPPGSTEPDDRPARAATIGTSHSGAIDPEGDHDWYERTLPAGRHRVRVVPPVPSNPLDPRGMQPHVEIFRPGALLEAATAADVDLPVTARFRLARQTLVRIHVANAASAASPGSYTLTIASSSTGTSSSGPPPALTRTAPADRATGVGSGVDPLVVFGRDIRATSIKSSTVRLLDGRTGAAVAATRAFTAATDTLVIEPAAPLAPGPYIVRLVNVRDTNGRRIDDKFRFTVGPRPDQTAPDTAIDSGPPDPTADPTATFTFSSPALDVVAFECRIDGGPYAPCTSGDSFVVASGQHTFEVFARDTAGNEDPTPAAHAWEYTP